MSSKSTVLYTDRDRQIHEALRLTPLDTQQLLKLSETFGRPFTSARKVRERMQQHQAAGWTTTYTDTTTGPGQLNYYRLTRAGYRLLSGPRAVLPKRSFFAEVSPALQRHPFVRAGRHRRQSPRPALRVWSAPARAFPAGTRLVVSP